jgi:multicomponent Na+:H+ antiporter subunit G
MAVAAGALLLIGALFSLLGAVGVLRMPDVFNKLQAGTKATTLGFLSLVAGTLALRPEWWSKLLLLAAFVVLTNPIGSHALARAAHRRREEMVLEAGVDRLAESEEAGR